MKMQGPKLGLKLGAAEQKAHRPPNLDTLARSARAENPVLAQAGVRH